MSPQDRQEEKPEGFSKYLKRMKTVLRPRSASKRQSFVVAPEVVAPAETRYAIYHSYTSTSYKYTNPSP
jgi:hypothetical protein